MDKQKIYFPNLNGLRFIAAFLVIIHHIEQFKSLYKMDNYLETVAFIGLFGKLGVVLFFVLSGFLITYLLLAEEDSFKTISIRKFYIRRILRIWPLYYLILLLAFFVLPNIGLFTLPGFGKNVIYDNLPLKLFLFAIFLPNLAIPLLGVIPYASHTWSIGTEEQYYLVWPLFLKYCKKYRLLLMVFIILFYVLFAAFLKNHSSDFIPNKTVIKRFWSFFSIDCMAIGGIFAILLFRKHRILRVLANKYLFYFTAVLASFLMLKGVSFPYIHFELYSVLFGIIILNLASNKNLEFSLENKVFNYLGNISYGLYMYHPIGIALGLAIGTSLGWVSNWFVYPASLVLTILLAGLSYTYYEKYFLKFKSRFSNIISGSQTEKRNT
jgi:peptidoglycan/LPS O-acetylase OafA/YrhL